MNFTITNFIGSLSDLGITVSTKGDKLRLDGNTAALSEEQISWLQKNKPVILAMFLLRQNPVRRFKSHDGQAEAYSSWTLDPAYWREIEN